MTMAWRLIGGVLVSAPSEPGVLLLDMANEIQRAILEGHPVWGDGLQLEHGWPAMLAWNLALAGLAARGAIGAPGGTS